MYSAVLKCTLPRVNRTVGLYRSIPANKEEGRIRLSPFYYPVNEQICAMTINVP